MPAGEHEELLLLMGASRSGAGSGRRRAAGLALAVLAAGAPFAVAAPAPPAHAAAGVDCMQSDSTDPMPVEGPNSPYESLGIGAAQDWLRERGRTPGAGVDVVVVDNGFAGADTTTQAPGYDGGAELATAHGAIVAGIIGGADESVDGVEVPIGFAPGARLHSVRAYEAPFDGDNASAEVAYPSSEVLAGALTQVASRIRSRALGDRTVVVVPFVVGRTDALTDAVAAVVDAGGLVIAASGDRPADTGDPVLGDFAVAPDDDGLPPGQDARGAAWPAAADDVLTVGVAPASAPEGSDILSVVVASSDIDVAAPAGDGISRGLNGAACWVAAPSTAWAAAAVAGVAALTWTRYGDADADAIRTRLQNTTDGNGIDAGPLTGYGVVQPLAALERRPGAWRDAGAGNSGDQVARAEAPPKPADVLAETRRNAVWWGLIGGGLLVVALVLRPVLSRRR